MEGDLEGPLRGIIPRSIEDIFGQIQNDPEPSSRWVRAQPLLCVRDCVCGGGVVRGIIPGSIEDI